MLGTFGCDLTAPSAEEVSRTAAKQAVLGQKASLPDGRRASTGSSRPVRLYT